MVRVRCLLSACCLIGSNIKCSAYCDLRSGTWRSSGELCRPCLTDKFSSFHLVEDILDSAALGGSLSMSVTSSLALFTDSSLFAVSVTSWFDEISRVSPPCFQLFHIVPLRRQLISLRLLLFLGFINLCFHFFLREDGSGLEDIRGGSVFGS